MPHPKREVRTAKRLSQPHLPTLPVSRARHPQLASKAALLVMSTSRGETIVKGRALRTNATSEARGKNRKAPQPTAPPNVAGEQGTPPASGDQQSAVSNVNKQEKSSRPKSAAVDASRDRGRQASNDGQGGGPRDSKKNAQSGANSQPPAANTGAPKQKQQKQVNQAQGAPPQPGTSQQRSNERKREQKPPSQPAAAKQNKPPPQQPAAAKQNQQPQRSAAPQQKAPSKPPNAPQGKGKGKGSGEKKPDEKKNEGGN